MKPYAALLALMITACLAIPAQAQQRLSGTWRVEEVGQAEPPEGVALTFSFGNEGKATITYTVGDEAQAWTYQYTVEEGRLTLNPVDPFGEAEDVEYEIRFEGAKLLLLIPKPEEEEPDTPDTHTDTDTGEGEGEGDGDSPEEEEEEEEEDTRKPEWVLVSAS